MLIRCPACGASASLDTIVDSDEARGLLNAALGATPVGPHLVRYIALFRPAKTRLSWSRVATLLGELLPDIRREAITAKGRDWPTPAPLWRAAIETLLAKRDAGTLVLPLTSHGLLHTVLAGLSDKAEAAQERETEADRRQRASVPASAPVSSHSPPLYRPERSTPAKPSADVIQKLKQSTQPATPKE